MKRLIRFLALFGLGLVALVLALGPGRLLRRTFEPTIAATSSGDAAAPIRLAEAGQKGRAIGVSLEGAGRIPIWKETIEPDGSTLRVKAALIAYDAIERFAGGFHLTRPVVELFPGRTADEPPNARLRAGGADLATRDGAGEIAQFSQGFRAEEVREFTLGPAAVIEQLDEATGDVAVTLETERLESPEAPIPESGSAPIAARLIAPGPAHLFRADLSLDLRAGGMELDRVLGRVTLRPPVSITSSELSLTADGPALFVRGAAGSVPRPDRPAAQDPFGLAGALGPGELVFTQNVFVKQAGRWLRSDRVVVELAEDATRRLVVERFDAGVQNAPLALRLFGGEGSARELHWNAATGVLVLDGPVVARDLAIGGGTGDPATPARKLLLEAAGRLLARELPADDALPARVEVELERDAHAEVAGELVARGERLLAVLVPPAKESSQAAGGEGGAKLLFVELFGGEQPATALLVGRGRARALRRIRLVDDGAGGHVAHLEGEARADVERGFVAGETIDVVAPADAGSPARVPMRVTVPQLSAGELALPAGGGLLSARLADGPSTSDEPRRLVLEPLAPTSLTSEGEVLDLVGRCRYHVRASSQSPDLQTLACAELHLAPDGAGEVDLRAVGDVLLVDLEGGVRARATVARTERGSDGRRRLVLLGDHGEPARVVFELPPKNAGEPSAGELDVAAARLVLDLESLELVADDELAQVRVVAPEALLASLVPSVSSTLRGAPPPDGRSADAGASPAELRADHVTATPGAGVKSPAEAFARARFAARGRVLITRPSSGATARCRELLLDGDRRFARLDGTPAAAGSAGEPVVVSQPRPYAEERVESMTAAWLEVRDGCREIDVAPGALFVLHPEEAPTEQRPLPRLVRVEIRAADPPELRGKRLLFSGGVETDLNHGEAHARSERAELLLDRPLDEGGATLVRLNASQRVRLDQGRFHGEGSLLSYDFATHWMELKEGVQPCSLLGQDEAGAWHATSRFRRMLVRVPQDEAVGGELVLEGLEVVVEGPRGRQ